MKQPLYLLFLMMAALMTGCAGSGGPKDAAGLSQDAGFYQAMGVADFIRDCRLEHACQLLKTTGMTIANVATSSGFSRVTTFNHDFKGRYNLSPSEYRRQ